MTNVLHRDDNHTAIQGNNAYLAIKSMTLAGATVNDPGDFNGTGNPATLFTVTGDVLISVFATCSVALVGAGATIEVGVTGDTANFIAQTTASDIGIAEVWIDNAPANKEYFPTESIISGTDIIQTVGTANITAGKLAYYALWRPLSSGASVVAA
jgi:hypothetical protein